MKKKLIFDTNALVSAVINAKSIPALVFETAKKEHDLFISEETITELQQVMARKKFDRYFIGNDATRREDFFTGYRASAQLVEVTETATECRDKDDNKFLSLALSVGADIIVSGDSDLLVLNPYHGIRILTIRQYEEENRLIL
ncbi:MAG: putative toxin-antitoxin system toxin component, PIN family [Phycisphaerae bacterium]|nr:putative toxin-antitoxin system toxin component, PIN family [Phycisphaerae bacterium]